MHPYLLLSLYLLGMAGAVFVYLGSMGYDNPADFWFRILAIVIFTFGIWKLAILIANWGTYWENYRP